MMNGRLIAMTAALMLAAGCATSTPDGSNYTHREVFAGPDMDVTLDNLLESSEDRSYQIMLNPVRVRDGDWGAKYYLEVRYEGAPDAGFMEIGPGDTLTVTVDGQAMKFRGPGSVEARRTTDRKTFVENAVYEARVDDLRKIAKAKDVKVQVNGNLRRFYREFKPENTQKFRSFVLTYMGY